MKTGLESVRRSLPSWLALAALLGVLITVACGSEPQAAEDAPDPNEEQAPSFELPAARGGMMSLSQLLDGKDALALVFYRGFF